MLPVSYCVINYNGEQRLARILAAVQAERRTIDEVLVVDDASEDGSVSVLRSLGSDVRLIELETNGGPGAARNAGFSAAKHDYVLFIDNDVVLRPGCTRALVAALESNPSALTAVPRVLYANDATVVQYEGADCHFLGLMIPRLANTIAEDHPSGEIASNNSIVTACFLIDRARWDGGPLFDETFIFNYEDHDFGVRARIMGHQLLSVSTAFVSHGDGTPGRSYRPSMEYAPMRIYCLIRNRWQVILKNYSFRTLLVLSPILLFYELFQLVGVIRRGWFRAWCRAVSWIFSNLSQVLRRRHRVQTWRRTPDGEFLQGGSLPLTPDVTRSPADRAAIAFINCVAGAYWSMARRLV